jgi:SAM-dependent methyltransferase
VVDPRTDRRRLTERAYATPTPLRARAALYEYEHDRVDLVPWVLRRVSWVDCVRVLDVGCGPGRYLDAIGALNPDTERVGLDLSPGMAQAAKRAGEVLVGDAQRLPFATRSFDAALAPHMMYHVPEIDLALTELARVLRPGGPLVVVTNGAAHLPEIFELLTEAAREASRHTSAPPARTFERFSVQTADAMLRAVFDEVELERLSRRIAVPVPAPVVEYVESMRSLYDAWLPAPDLWPAVMRAVRDRVEKTLDEAGAWRTTSDVGCFVCRNR